MPPSDWVQMVDLLPSNIWSRRTRTRVGDSGRTSNRFSMIARTTPCGTSLFRYAVAGNGRFSYLRLACGRRGGDSHEILARLASVGALTSTLTASMTLGTSSSDSFCQWCSEQLRWVSLIRPAKHNKILEGKP